MGKRHVLGCAALVVASQATAQAQDAVHIRTTIPYVSEQVGSQVIREKCDWNRKLSQLIVKESKGKVIAMDDDLASIGGKTLDIVVTGTHVIAGNNVSGPKWAKIYGELKDNGAVTGTFGFRRVTGFRPFTFSVCSHLTNIAEAFSGDVVRWLANPGIDPNASRAPQAGLPEQGSEAEPAATSPTTTESATATP